MKRSLSLFVFVLHAAFIFSINYYVNAVDGSDDNPGTEPCLAWKSLVQVNRTRFTPGDTIFLARGSRWHEYLQPGGSGSWEAPIVITAYGEGKKPLLIGTGETGRGILSLFNQSHWEISSLEIVNNGREHADRRGVEIRGENAGVIHHIYLRDLYIHHVMGLPGNGLDAKKTAGIYFEARDDASAFTRFDDVLIEGCIIHDVINQGIALIHSNFQGGAYPGEGTWDERKFTRFAIRDNVIYNISKNAMIIRMTEDGIVERNLCFNTALGGTGNTIFSRNVLRTLFQHNEGLLNRSHDHDGSFYDPDLNSPGTTWRYSYSHRNAHGLLWLCTTGKDGEISVYHNLSESDKGILNYFNYAYDQVDVYGNIYLSGKEGRPYLIRENPSNYHHRTLFRENVIINRNKEMHFEYQPEKVSQEARDRRVIERNLFFGMPLQGDYNGAEGAVPSTRYIHRGFHHVPDELDALYGQSPRGVGGIRKEIDERVEVSAINGIPVYKEELDQKVQELETIFYSLNKGEPARDSLQGEALNELFLEKIIIGWMARKGLKAAEILENIDRYLSEENRFRQENIQMSDSLFFGPRGFTRDVYHAYMFAYGIEELKAAMWGNELQATDEELSDFFLVGDLGRFDPKWASRGYDYSLPAVERMLRDQKFNAFIHEELKNGNIDFQEHGPLRNVPSRWRSGKEAVW